MHSSGFEEYAGISPAVAGAIPQWGGVMDLDVLSEEEYVPLCMIHGTDDTNVPYDSGYCYNGMLPGMLPYMYGSHPIACRLDEIGITDYEFHPFEGEGHAFYFIPLLYTLIEEKFDACFNITRDFLYNHLVFPTSIPEIAETMVQVYPNPAKGRFTIEGSGTMTVTNALGHTILTQGIDGKATVELPRGMYFVKLGDATRKIVVE